MWTGKKNYKVFYFSLKQKITVKSSELTLKKPYFENILGLFANFRVKNDLSKKFETCLNQCFGFLNFCHYLKFQKKMYGFWQNEEIYKCKTYGVMTSSLRH